MAMQTTTNPADVLNRFQTYFNRKLLEPLTYTLVLDQFATTQDLPRNMGAKTMRFYRRRQADASQVQSLTEGVAISTFEEVTTGYVDVTLAQLGEAFKMSDILEWTDIFKWFDQNVIVMGEDAALKCDTVIRNIIISTMLNSNGSFERFAGVTNTGNSANDFATLSGGTPANGKFTRLSALGCVTQLRSQKVPMINGTYIGAVPPQVMHDIRLDTTWTQTGQFSRPDSLYNMEQIQLDGVRYVVHNNPFTETVYGTLNTTIVPGTVFSSFFIGRGAYGVPKLAGTSSPMKPQVILTRGNDKADPLNQFSIGGWKAYYNALMLTTNLSGDPYRLCNFRSLSTFN